MKTILTMQVPPELDVRLRKLKTERGMARAWIVRTAIKEYLDRLESSLAARRAHEEELTHERHDAA